MSAAKIALIPFGSEGDVNPLIWAARALADHGHRPCLLLTPNYGPLADAADIPWLPVGKPGDFEAMTRDPRFWRPFTGPAHVARAMLATFPEFQRAWSLLPWKPELAIVTTFALAPAFSAEAAGIPRILLHMQPSVLASAHELPVFAQGLGGLSRAPLPLRQAFAGLVRKTLSTLLLPPLNRRRLQLRLPPWKTFRDLIFSAQGVGLFFPEVLASRTRDEPPHIRRLGFPLPHHAPPLPAALSRWMEEVGPPVVWTHGSANSDTAHFARCALGTADIQPCLLIGKATPPQPLPARALHVPHVPFESLFPRCRAIVHHGGIGTVAKALAARRPQLIIPRSHDQPDNAARVVRLGRGHTLSYLQLSPRTARAALKNLLAAFPRDLPELPGLRASPGEFVEWIEETLELNSPGSKSSRNPVL